VAVPGAAAADTTVRVVDDDVGPSLAIRGDAAASQLSVEAADGTATVRDPATALAPGDGCTAVDPHTVTCAVAAAELSARLGEGDDALTVLAGAWDILRLAGDAGDDRIDAALPTSARGAVIRGGDGDDELVGTGKDDIVNGNAGADTIRGGADADIIEGDEGADELYGENGADSLESDDDDTVLDGGAGNDYFDTSGSEEPVCGDGDNDQVGITYGVAPGPLYGADCEGGFDFDPDPVAVAARSVTFRVQCNDAYGPCHSTLIMRWKGKVAARRAYSAKGSRNQLVTLPVGRKLARALKRGTLLRMQIRGFHHEIAEGTDEVKVDEFWRVRAAR
jgi:hypothetical protein